MIYLFCFTSSVHFFEIEGTAVDGEHPLFLCNYRNIVAVLSLAYLEEFQGISAESRMQDLSWVGPRAFRHEEVVEKIMRCSPVFPARFGTLFSSLESLQALMENHFETIVNFLSRVADKSEWGVKVMLDRKKSKENLLSSLLDRQSEHLASLSPGKRYLHERRIGSGLERELNGQSKKNLGVIADDLNRFAREFCDGNVLARNLNKSDKDSILNWAFLVPRHATAEFHAQMDLMNRDYGPEGLGFELSGPWPPYSFSPPLISEPES